MLTDKVHVCLETPGAPEPGAEFEVDARWICSCGDNYVYRDGFNRAGYKEMSWFRAPALVIPKQRMQDRLRDLVIRPRRGN